MNSYYNPYSGETFFGFFLQFAFRFWAFLTGKISVDNWVSDEIQIFVLMGVAASTAILGCFLVLRKMTMLANALSHTILLGIVAAYAITLGLMNNFSGDSHDPINMSAMLSASLAMGLLTTFFTEFLNKNIGLQEDASIGIVFSSLFALGVILVTLLTRSAHVGTEVVMGNVDSLEFADCKLVYLTLSINVVMIWLLFKEFQVTTFDQGFARSMGFSPTIYNYLLMVLVSATSIAAFRAVGVLMVLSFLTGPALTARLLTNSLKVMIFFSVLIGLFCAFAGVALSRHFLSVYGMALSTGGIVVSLIVATFSLTLGGKLFFRSCFRRFSASLGAKA